jgi:hypothetical protein
VQQTLVFEAPTERRLEETAQSELVSVQLAGFLAAAADPRALRINPAGLVDNWSRLARSWTAVLLAGLWFLALAVVLRRGLKLVDRLQLPDWMAVHPAIVVTACGLLWWSLCLQGFLGVLAVGAALLTPLLRLGRAALTGARPRRSTTP